MLKVAWLLAWRMDGFMVLWSMKGSRVFGVSEQSKPCENKRTAMKLGAFPLASAMTFEDLWTH